MKSDRAWQASRKIVSWAAVGAAIFLSPATGSATELFVDQKNAAADDRNTGAEAVPFKTIQPAVEQGPARRHDLDQARQLRGPGGAQQERHGGQADRPQRVEGRPRADRLPAPAPARARRLAADPRQQELADQARRGRAGGLLGVCWTSKAILTWMQDGPPKDEKVNWASYRKSDRTLMFNAGGKNPGRLGQIRIWPAAQLPVAS